MNNFNEKNHSCEQNNITIMSPERHIEVMYNHVKKILFEDKFYSWVLNNKEVDDLMQIFNGSYWLVKAKFQYIERNTWWRYFDHIIRVTYLMLKKSKNPTFNKTLISMNHDIIEDTDITFQSLKDILSLEQVAFWVLLISKKPFWDFINNIKDYNTFQEIKNSWILNSKWFLSDAFLIELKNNPNSINNEKKEFLKQYKKLLKKYKEKKNDFFFSHMKNYETFYQHALSLNKDYWIYLNNKELEKIVLEALEVKYWDRIDNLQTSEIYTEFNKENLKKAKRKLKETETYFYDISKETHPYIHKLIKTEIERLRTHIIVKEMEKNSDLVNKVLK